MRKIKNWFVGVGLAIAGLFGYHAQIPETSVIEVVPQVTPAPTPIQMNDKRISLSCDDTCTDKERNELPNIEQKLLVVESGDCFESNVKLNLDPSQLNGMGIDSAVKLVMSAHVNTEITYYYQGRNWFTKTLVIGYENGDGKIHANRAAWDYMSLCEKTSNVAHELTHGDPMNFSHDFNATARRPSSLPYVVGEAILNCCRD